MSRPTITAALVATLGALTLPAHADSSTTCRRDSGGHLVCKRVDRETRERCTTTCRTDSGGHEVCKTTCR